MTYASVEDVQKGFRTLTEDELSVCEALIDEAGVIIDAYRSGANDDVKNVVTCRMVRRALGESDSAQAFPLGTTQGSVSAGGYSQSWTIGGGGSAGELYLGKLEKKLLGVGNSIGSYSPVQERVVSID